ncbi:DUF2975 domain-containing protein [Anaeromicrobium sediminis]|uniref:DUF2975 domain-containing protein n=1 Tax=Anaeromicrobium sediminis TaxID=1478221 RepID=A0A267MJR6_9FIRM|nr:DUF2975 domain-containing protein [Anaeromicrobium sediminis]PAB59030.1 hypothetical protein CCE28_12670 [Anaeromicrobium sediminis]
MKYYGKKSLASALKLVLNFLLIIGVCMFVYISKNVMSSNDLQISIFRKIGIYGLFFIGSISLILIVYNLKKIVDSLVDINPFIRGNVKRLNSIALECFIITGCYLINFVINPKYVEFNLITVDMKGIHTDMEFFIFLFAGCFILILSKVFEQAVEVKEDNDLTI